jgi:tRNA 5-methylaminomethyl-2-thiouridine biosynthesis bifunctional protein
MPDNTSDHYDVAVIGAGIAGVSAAFALRERGARVVLIDRSSVPASGGSGAAGAFVAPKIGKGGPLQQLTNEAFAYAHHFYRTHTPESFTRSGVVRIPRDDADAERFVLYEPHNHPVYERWSAEDLSCHAITDPNGGFCFPEAGDCDAPAVCRALAEGIDFVQMEVGSVERLALSVEAVWQIVAAKNGLKKGAAESTFCIAKKVVLATGYQNDLFDMRYMGIKGLWGSRGDYRTAVERDVSLHKHLSVSSSRRGIVKIGATHVKHSNPCMVCDGQPLAGLFAGASELVDTSDFVLHETFCGMRSGSRDFFPVVGNVIDVPHMLAHHPDVVRGAKPPLKHLDGVYVINGLGGRGFVMAPLMAQWLADRIVDQAPLSSSVHPDRLFWKWARKYL